MAAPIPIPILDALPEMHDATLYSLTPSNFLETDLTVIWDFLSQYNGNKSTFEAYRREVERLLQWSLLIKQSSVLSHKRQDIEDYLQFCLSPPRSWIGVKKVSRFVIRGGERKPNKEWRPFIATVDKADHKEGVEPSKAAYNLSQKSIREIFTVLSSFYNYALQEEKVIANPVALIKQKSKFLQKRQQQATVMRLSENQWKYCLAAAETMANEDSAHERTLFALIAMYLMYLRISELAASERWVPQMNHFYKDSQDLWWFKTVGKGNKLRTIAVGDSMLAALKRYRKSFDFSALPSAKDDSPLMPKEKGAGAMSSTRHIRRLLQQCFDKAADSLRSAGLSEDAESIKIATVHWLRHTGISDDINKHGRPVAHVRDDAGHSSSAITDRYNDIELTERHKSAQYKLMK